MLILIALYNTGASNFFFKYMIIECILFLPTGYESYFAAIFVRAGAGRGASISPGSTLDNGTHVVYNMMVASLTQTSARWPPCRAPAGPGRGLPARAVTSLRWGAGAAASRASARTCARPCAASKVVLAAGAEAFMNVDEGEGRRILLPDGLELAIDTLSPASRLVTSTAPSSSLMAVTASWAASPPLAGGRRRSRTPSSR